MAPQVMQESFPPACISTTPYPVYSPPQSIPRTRMGKDQFIAERADGVEGRMDGVLAP